LKGAQERARSQIKPAGHEKRRWRRTKQDDKGEGAEEERSIYGLRPHPIKVSRKGSKERPNGNQEYGGEGGD